MNEVDYWNNEWTGRGLDPTSDFAQKVITIIRKHGLVKILDLGCGNGRDSIFFAQNGLDVTALDIAGAAASNFQEFPAIKFIQQDLRDLSFPPESIDAVYANLSLHYFDDATTKDIVGRLFRSLRPGGYIFIKCKSTDDLLFGQGEKVADNIYLKDHVRHFFSVDYMKEVLSRFDIVSIEETSSVHQSYQASFVEGIAVK